jgi:hypothetical protein
VPAAIRAKAVAALADGGPPPWLHACGDAAAGDGGTEAADAVMHDASNDEVMAEAANADAAAAERGGSSGGSASGSGNGGDGTSVDDGDGGDGNGGGGSGGSSNHGDGSERRHRPRARGQASKRKRKAAMRTQHRDEGAADGDFTVEDADKGGDD